MAKGKGKKLKKKGKKIGQLNAKIEKAKVLKISSTKTIIPVPAPAPAPFTYPFEGTASNPMINNNAVASHCKEREMKKTECLSGFIFMCNPRTKIECYQYRVFGVPLGQKEVVEKIKPGTKLFLYDFESKLLYGIYEATSAGSLNLEPAAFSGNFPAQVKFKIFKECLPLPESFFRHVISKNNTALKFNQELSKKKVMKLTSSFHPLTASSSLPAPRAPEYASFPGAIPPSAMENQFWCRGRPHVMEIPDLAEMQYSHSRPVAESQFLIANYSQHGSHRTAAYVEHVYPTLDHPSLPATSSYYVATSQQPSFTKGIAHGVQEPPYSRYVIEERATPAQRDRPIEESALPAHVTGLNRYRLIEESALPAQVNGLERYRPIEARALPAQVIGLDRPIEEQASSQVAGLERYRTIQERTHEQDINLERRYGTVEERAPREFSILERYHQLPSQREAFYQDFGAAHSSNPEPYIPSVIQTGASAPHHHQLPLQREAVYQDFVAAHSSNSEPYIPSVMQTRASAPHHHQLPLQREAVYQDYVAAHSSNSEPYTPSVMQTGAPTPPPRHHQLPLQYPDNFNTMVTPQYTASVTQPQVPPYWYSYATGPSWHDR